MDAFFHIRITACFEIPKDFTFFHDVGVYTYLWLKTRTQNMIFNKTIQYVSAVKKIHQKVFQLF